MSTQWVPKRSLSETDKILRAPGMLHETETRVVGNQVLRVYKHLWPSLREFWTFVSNEYKDMTYIVFEQQRWTYGQISQRAALAARLFQVMYGIRKGDRVAICSRNFPDFIVAFWACHLIGAVSVLVNAWHPLPALHHCFVHTQSKLIIVDPERADLIEPIVTYFPAEAGTTGVLVLEYHEGKGRWKGMRSWNHVLNNFSGSPWEESQDVPILPEDNATIIFTSGTTGKPKGVLSTQRMFLTNIRNMSAAGVRAILRNGSEDLIAKQEPQTGILVAVPLFHAAGTSTLVISASVNGQKIVLMRKWIPDEGISLIKRENVTTAGGVPTIVSDIVDSGMSDSPLKALVFGGSSVNKRLPEMARQAFPNIFLSQAYGLTETNGVSVGFTGNDYTRRPTSAGLPSPVNDILIVKDGVSQPVGHIGEIWLRGPNVMKEYWGDPDATAETITKDGWLRTGDLGVLDEEGFLYIRDRIKDMIISGGENIDSVSVENALYTDPRLKEVAAVGVPDDRLGELVAAVVFTKPAFKGHVVEEELINLARERLPRFAVPVMVMILDEPFERTPTEKIVKGPLRILVKEEWTRRRSAALVKRPSKL